MRPALALTLGVAFFVSLAGCTLLVSFDDIPDAGSDLGTDGTDSGFGSSSSSSSSSSGSGTSSSTSSSGSPDAGPKYPPPCDTSVDLTTIDCGGHSGTYCGSDFDLLTLQLLTPTDLIECTNGKPTCVRHCTMGCALNPDEALDQCADCKDPTNADIWYCGKDVGWTGTAADYAFECKKGKWSKSSGCGTDLCHSTCTRTDPAPLPGACCQTNPE